MLRGYMQREFRCKRLITAPGKIQTGKNALVLQNKGIERNGYSMKLQETQVSHQ